MATLLALFIGVFAAIVVRILLSPRKSHDKLAALRIQERLDALLEKAGITFDPYESLPAGIRQAIQTNQKIEAIKRYRELTGVGLKEAKEFIEDLSSPERQIQKKLDLLLADAKIPFGS